MDNRDGSMKSATAMTTRNRIAAAVMALIGLFVIVQALGYGLGSVFRLGPGALPFGLGILLMVLGACIVLVNDDGDHAAPPLAWRPVVTVLSSLLAFALLIDSAGLLVAAAGLVGLSGLADPEHNWRSVAVIYVVLVIAVYVIFVRFLSIPFKLIVGVF